MWKHEIKVGLQYAIREKRARGEPLQRIRIIEHIRGSKWKAKWIDPNPGLVHYVDSSNLIVPWREHKAFLREEQSGNRLWEYNERQGIARNSPDARALQQIFESLGDDIEFTERDGVLVASPEALNRVRKRALIPDDQNSPVAFKDRQGDMHLPFDDALRIARALCAAEPSTFLLGRVHRTTLGGGG